MIEILPIQDFFHCLDVIHFSELGCSSLMLPLPLWKAVASHIPLTSAIETDLTMMCLTLNSGSVDQILASNSDPLQSRHISWPADEI
jgi:hypothetical protein